MPTDADEIEQPVRISDLMRDRRVPYSRTTIYTRIKKGALPAHRDGGFWWIKPADARKLLTG
jgi:hypothetical protein